MVCDLLADTTCSALENDRRSLAQNLSGSAAYFVGDECLYPDYALATENRPCMRKGRRGCREWHTAHVSALNLSRLQILVVETWSRQSPLYDYRHYRDAFVHGAITKETETKRG